MLAVTAGVLLGTAGTAAALAPADATPVALGVVRIALGAVVLLALVPRLGGSWARIPPLLARPTVWVMAAGSGFFQPLFFGAAERSGVALSTLVAIGSAPALAGILGWAVMKDRPTAGWVGATTVAVVGLSLRSGGGIATSDRVGLAMALGAGLCLAAYVVTAKVELDRGANVVELPAAAYLLGTLLLAPSLVGESLAWVATAHGALTALYLGGVTMALANVVQVRGLRGLPPGPAATLLLADPMTATLLGLLLLGETIDRRGLAGVALVLVGLLFQGRASGAMSRHGRALTPAL